MISKRYTPATRRHTTTFRSTNLF